MRYLLFLLGTFFVALRAFSVISWSWWWVLTPWLILAVGYLLLFAFIGTILTLFAKNHPEEVKKFSEYLKRKK